MFEVGKNYRHNGGMTMRVLARLQTSIYGETLIAERSLGDFAPVAEHEGADANWEEISVEEYTASLARHEGRRVKLHEVPPPATTVPMALTGPDIPAMRETESED